MKSEKNLKPLFKYPGGKGSEYKYFKHFIPEFSKYVEPFVGGGAVYWATNAEKLLINDYSAEVMSVYKYVKEQDKKFINYVYDIANIWDIKNDYAQVIEKKLKVALEESTDENLELNFNIYGNINWLENRDVNLNNEIKESFKRKLKSLKKVSMKAGIKNIYENALGIIGSAVYTDLRTIYNSISYSQNPQLKTSIYLFLREYAYASMFRYNSLGQFNVPFGGNSYAKKSFFNRYNQIKNLETIKKLENTKLVNKDFSSCLPDEIGTFIFLDPPYDTEFSTYNLHVFDASEQVRLHDRLINLKKSKWMMIVKSTKFIEELYSDNFLYLNQFDKKYSVNIQNRNQQKVEHLVITNYKI